MKNTYAKNYNQHKHTRLQLPILIEVEWASFEFGADVLFFPDLYIKESLTGGLFLGLKKEGFQRR